MVLVPNGPANPAKIESGLTEACRLVFSSLSAKSSQVVMIHNEITSACTNAGTTESMRERSVECNVSGDEWLALSR